MFSQFFPPFPIGQRVSTALVSESQLTSQWLVSWLLVIARRCLFARFLFTVSDPVTKFSQNCFPAHHWLSWSTKPADGVNWCHSKKYDQACVFEEACICICPRLALVRWNSAPAFGASWCCLLGPSCCQCRRGTAASAAVSYSWSRCNTRLRYCTLAIIPLILDTSSTTMRR